MSVGYYDASQNRYIPTAGAGVAYGTKAEIAEKISRGELADGQEVIITDDYVDGETIDEIKAKLEKLGIKELWKNPDVSVGIGETTISVDLSNCDFIILDCLRNVGTTSHYTGFAPCYNGSVGHVGGLIPATPEGSDVVCERIFTINSNGVKLGNIPSYGVGQSSSVLFLPTNTYLVPYAIYGGKFA